MEDIKKLKAAQIAKKFATNAPYFETLQDCYEYLGQRFSTFKDYYTTIKPKTLVLIVFYTFLYQRNKNFDFANSLDGKIFFANMFGSTGNEYRETCDSCDGDGQRECGECDGRGDMTCPECDGDSEVDCEDCAGTGEDNDGEPCDTCQGGGRVRCDWCGGEETIECSECSGTGSVECWQCDGIGEVETDKMVYEIDTYCSIDRRFYDYCERILDTFNGIDAESMGDFIDGEKTFKTTTHEDQDELDSFVENDTFYCCDLEILEEAKVYDSGWSSRGGFFLAIDYSPQHYTT